MADSTGNVQNYIKNMFQWFKIKKYDPNIIIAFEEDYYKLVIFGANIFGNMLITIFKIVNLI